jgi:hypothetical protein
VSLVDASAIGASAADCFVCGIDTYYRLAVGDGHAPICSSECERAFPRMREIEEHRKQWRRSAILTLDVAERAIRALEVHDDMLAGQLRECIPDFLRSTHDQTRDGGK